MTSELINWICPHCGHPNIDFSDTLVPMCGGCNQDVEWQVIDSQKETGQ